MGRRLVVVKLICSLGHCECDGHTVHSLSQWRLTADWLAPREIDCLQMHSKVSSDWLPSYNKATRPVLEIQNGWILSGQTSYIVSKRWPPIIQWHGDIPEEKRPPLHQYKSLKTPTLKNSLRVCILLFMKNHIHYIWVNIKVQTLLCGTETCVTCFRT